LKSNDGLKYFISKRLGEKNNYKNAIFYIVNDILSESKSATSWKNTESFKEYIKCLFSDKAYLLKTIDFIKIKADERLKNYRRNITNLIQEYLEIMSNKIDTERNITINYLQEQIEYEYKKNKELLEQRLEEVGEKKKKWKILCEEFVNLEEKIKQIFKYF